jgi:predicted acyltransferase
MLASERTGRITIPVLRRIGTKNSNLAAAFDRWFLNLFPREKPFTHNSGGYSTLSFIPTLATMILGLVAGGWLRLDITRAKKCLYLLAAGAVCIVLGGALDYSGICPSVKKIWTPAWTLFSGGCSFLFLAGFYAVVDGLGCWPPVYPVHCHRGKFHCRLLHGPLVQWKHRTIFPHALL